MDNRNGLFTPKNDNSNNDENAKYIKRSRHLDLIQHYIKGPIASWLKEDANNRIPILQQALKDSFSPESPSYASLPPIFHRIFTDPKKHLGKIDVDDPAKTIHTLAEQASTTALDEYMNTHPEYEEKILSDRKNNAENEKLVKQALNNTLASNTSSIETLALEDLEAKESKEKIRNETQNENSSRSNKESEKYFV